MRAVLLLAGLAGLIGHNLVYAQEEAAMTTVVIGTETFTLPAFTNGGGGEPPNPPSDASTATGPPFVSIPSPSVTPTNTVTLGGGESGTQTGYGSPPPECEASNTGDVTGPSPTPSPSHDGQPPTITAGAPENRAMGAVIGAFGLGAVVAGML